MNGWLLVYQTSGPSRKYTYRLEVRRGFVVQYTGIVVGDQRMKNLQSAPIGRKYFGHSVCEVLTHLRSHGCRVVLAFYDE